MLLAQIIGKTLALVDGFLELFATSVAGDSTTTIGLSNCALAINANISAPNACGTALIQALGGLVVVGIAGLQQLLPAIFTY